MRIEQIIKPSTIENLVPTGLKLGDRDFWGHPRMWVNTTLRISNDRRRILADVFFRAQETKPDWSTVEQTWRGVEVWSAPDTRFIAEIKGALTSRTDFQPPGDGGFQFIAPSAEWNKVFDVVTHVASAVKLVLSSINPIAGKIADGVATELKSYQLGMKLVKFAGNTVHAVIPEGGWDGRPLGPVEFFLIVGDTGGDDISTDADGTDDTRIVAIEFKNLEVVLSDDWLDASSAFSRDSKGLTIAATARRTGIIDIFHTRGQQVETTWWVDGDRGWRSGRGGWDVISGGIAEGSIAAVARKPGQLDVFVVSWDGSVYTSWWTEGVSGWSGVMPNRWRNIGGPRYARSPWSRLPERGFLSSARISAVSRHPGQLDLFAIGQDGRVYSSEWTEGENDWSGLNDRWQNIGGIFGNGAPVTAIARGPGQLDLFIAGNDGRVYTSWWNEETGIWSGVGDRWRNIGGVFPPRANISAVARLPSQLDLFVVGFDGRVYTSWWGGGVSDWSGLGDRWTNIGGGIFRPGSPVAAVARRTGHIDLFVVGNDGNVYTSWWSETTNVWSGVVGSWHSIGTRPGGGLYCRLEHYRPLSTSWQTRCICATWTRGVYE